MPRSITGEGRRRVVIENVQPAVDGGRFAIKRCTGDSVTVEADAFVDGHDSIRCVLMYRRRGEKRWSESPMAFLGNDRWRAEFAVTEIGTYEYTVMAWADHFVTWRHDIARWTAAEDVAVSLAVGSLLINEAAARARGADAKKLKAWSESLLARGDPLARKTLALDADLNALADLYPDRSQATVHEPFLGVTVDPPLACFSAWYELFPRSTAAKPGAHGTFGDVEARLPYIAQMGFNVLYLPPIHPIGVTRRKGRNNAVAAAAGDHGSPWAIGSAEGGHKSIHPQLGSAADFRRLVTAARGLGIEVALDIAFQCSPDHPYVKEHPAWFRHRPDGTVQYAENPPKKYQDIYPFNFETEDWKALWEELKSIFLHWIGEGVRVFRVDNPHTKPFPFWEWCIGEIKAEHPDVLFLAEAFTRPKVMHRLAKLGFNQSYTYFTWRNTRQELVEYFTELSQHASRDYFRPNVWPNTPDILHEYLQHGGRPAFMIRAVLAATLSASYGIYGPAYELFENVPREPGSEEYLNSEKYEIRQWDLDRHDSLRDLLARLNALRKANPALHTNGSLRFHATDNDMLICYSKGVPHPHGTIANVVLTVVCLDPHHVHAGWVSLDLNALGLDPGQHYLVHDQLADVSYTWNGPHNFVRLDPRAVPAHVFVVQQGTGGPRLTGARP
jgi:starch synthase (maltosyl-transferring)